MRVMENETLRVSVSDHGAELCSVYDRKNDREVIWNADPAYWNRHAPVLFPFVGKVNGGYYTHKGVRYPMGQHGFARDKEFVCAETSENQIVHRLVSDESTKAVYPFDFALTIIHRLEGNTVTVCWEVENTGTEELFFSIGGHPAFQIPEEYTITFNQDLEGLQTDELEYVLIDPETSGVDAKHPKTLKLDNGRLPYHPQLFDNDALIFDNGQVQRLGILLDGQKYVTLTCKEFPSVGVWSKPGANAPYVCLEPWIGRCDNMGFAGELKDKYGEQHLEPGKVFTASYTIAIGGM